MFPSYSIVPLRPRQGMDPLSTAAGPIDGHQGQSGTKIQNKLAHLAEQTEQARGTSDALHYKEQAKLQGEVASLNIIDASSHWNWINKNWKTMSNN
jgi:hypothetical protein